MASKRVVRVPARVPMLPRVIALLIMFLFLGQRVDAASESNSKATLNTLGGHRQYYPDKSLHVFPRLQRSTQIKSHPAVEEAEDIEATDDEPHPADELLQSQDADGSQSYILGGY